MAHISMSQKPHSIFPVQNLFHSKKLYPFPKFMDKRPSILASPLQEGLLNATICLGQFLSQGSITMSLSTMNIVLESFSKLQKQEIPSSQQVWFMGSFALTVGTFILISGRLGDLFGLKKMFLFGWFWAALWSLITGITYYTQSSVFYIVCRALQGIGFAFILPCGMGILGTVYPNGKRKNLAFGAVGASAPVGATIGCLMAAVVAQTWWWPWAYWLLCITCFIVGCISIYAIPDPFKHHDISAGEAIRRFDTTGSLLGIAGLVLFNFVWNQGPVVGWRTPYVIALLVVGVLLLVAFFTYELLFATHPLLPRAIFNKRIGLVLFCMSFGWGSFGVWQYYYWHILLNLRNYTPILGAVSYIPLLVLGIVAALLVGTFITKRRAPFIICGSMIGFMSGCIILSVAPVHQTYWRLTFGQMFLLTWGMDASFPAALLILSDYLPKEHQGMAGSLVNTVINYSVSLFLAVASAVEAERVRRNATPLEGYRAGLYFGIGVAGMAVAAAVVFILVEAKPTPAEPVETKDGGLESTPAEPVESKGEPSTEP